MKYAVVTGASSGIGLGVAKMLLSKGYKVFATYYGEKAEDIPEGIELFELDQTDRGQVHAFIESIRERISHLDCLICNAGTSIRKSFQDYTDEDWDKMMELSLNSHFIMCRDFYPIIPAGSRIIFTGSQMGLNPHASVCAYGVSKAAVHALCKNLVKVFEGSGTTVNAVVPGFVETNWHKGKSPEIRQRICEKTALKRFASVEEVVDAFRFCIENPFVNGSLIEVNGGYDYK